PEGARVQAVRVAAQHEVALGCARLGAAGDGAGHVHIRDGAAVALVGDEGVAPAVLLRRGHAVPAPRGLGAQQRAGGAGRIAWGDRIGIGDRLEAGQVHSAGEVSVAHGQRGGGFDLVDLDGIPVDEGSAVDGLGHGAQASGRLSKSGMSTGCRLAYPRASLASRLCSANGITVGFTCTDWVWKESRCWWT